MTDVEMKPADAKGKEDKMDNKKEEKPKPPPTPEAEIKSNVVLIEKAVSTMEPRFTHRVLRTLTALRKRINDVVLRNVIEETYPKGMELMEEFIERMLNFSVDSSSKKNLLVLLPPAPKPVDHSMEIDSALAPTLEPLPEVEIYFRLLILHHFLSTPSTYSKALELAHATIEKMQALNRRSMDPIAAKVWYAVERAYELGGELANARP